MKADRKTSHWLSRLLAAAVLAAASACTSTPSPDTPEQLREKLLTVDGDGSGLDADLLDGKSAADLTYVAGAGLSGGGNTFAVDFGAVQRRVTGTCAAGTFATAVGEDGTLNCASPPAGGGGAVARQVVVVPAAGTAAQNGAALRAAVATAVATPSKTWVISLDAGDYDVGSQPMALGANTHLAGAGIAATRILGQGSGTVPRGVVSVAAGSGPFSRPELRSLTIRCTGDVTCSALEITYAGPTLRSVSLEADLIDGDAYGVHGSYISGSWRDVSVEATSAGAGVTVAGMWVGRYQPDVLDLRVVAYSSVASAVIGVHLEEGSVPDIRKAQVSVNGPPAVSQTAVRVAMGYLRLYDSVVFGYGGTAIAVASGQQAVMVNSKIEGPRVGPGTLKCLSSYDELYNPLGSGC